MWRIKLTITANLFSLIHLSSPFKIPSDPAHLSCAGGKTDPGKEIQMAPSYLATPSISIIHTPSIRTPVSSAQVLWPAVVHQHAWQARTESDPLANATPLAGAGYSITGDGEDI